MSIATTLSFPFRWVVDDDLDFNLSEEDEEEALYLSQSGVPLIAPWVAAHREGPRDSGMATTVLEILLPMGPQCPLWRW